MGSRFRSRPRTRCHARSPPLHGRVPLLGREPGRPRAGCGDPREVLRPEGPPRPGRSERATFGRQTQVRGFPQTVHPPLPATHDPGCDGLRLPIHAVLRRRVRPARNHHRVPRPGPAHLDRRRAGVQRPLRHHRRIPRRQTGRQVGIVEALDDRIRDLPRRPGGLGAHRNAVEYDDADRCGCAARRLRLRARRGPRRAGNDHGDPELSDLAARSRLWLQPSAAADRVDRGPALLPDPGRPSGHRRLSGRGARTDLGSTHPAPDPVGTHRTRRRRRRRSCPTVQFIQLISHHRSCRRYRVGHDDSRPAGLPLSKEMQ